MSGIGWGVAGLKKLVGLVLPMFANPGDFAGLDAWAKLALRAVALLVVLVTLGGINNLLRLEAIVNAPPGLGGLGQVWLPLLFLLVCAFCWLVAWLWSQLGPDRNETSFPDIERAWREAVQALDRAGVGLNDLPVFLILGRPQGPEGALFEGAELQLKVRGLPDREDAPVRVYASREAIFVTCAEASVLGHQAAILGLSEFEAPAPVAAVAGDQTGFDMMTLGPTGGGNQEEAAIIARAQQAGRGAEALLPEELRALGRLAAARDVGKPGASAATRSGTAHNLAEISQQEARLRHLGRLIARERRPFCPINGILLLIPIAATNSEQSASRAGQHCRRDLEAVRLSMQVRCPVFVLVCDLENLTGFRELIERLPEDQKRRRMGQRFPFIPDVDRSAIPALMESAVKWIAHRLLPAQVTSLWRVEATSGLAMTESLRTNVRLYHLLRQVRERHTRLARILSHAVLADESQPAMLGGCYIAGTGADHRSEQAFIPGVFRRLIDSQDLVSWTPELLAQENRYGWWVRVGYSALIVLVVASLGLVVFVIWENSRSSSAPVAQRNPVAPIAGSPLAHEENVAPGIRAGELRSRSLLIKPRLYRNMATATTAVSPGLTVALAVPRAGGVSLTQTTS